MSSDTPAATSAGTDHADTAIADGGEAGSLSTSFGPVPCNPEQQIHFHGGLPGFPDLETYQLMPPPGSTGDLLLLQSVEVPEIAFFVVPLGDSA